MALNYKHQMEMAYNRVLALVSCVVWFFILAQTNTTNPLTRSQPLSYETGRRMGELCADISTNAERAICAHYCYVVFEESKKTTNCILGVYDGILKRQTPTVNRAEEPENVNSNLEIPIRIF